MARYLSFISDLARNGHVVEAATITQLRTGGRLGAMETWRLREKKTEGVRSSHLYFSIGD